MNVPSKLQLSRQNLQIGRIFLVQSRIPYLFKRLTHFNKFLNAIRVTCFSTSSLELGTKEQ